MIERHYVVFLDNMQPGLVFVVQMEKNLEKMYSAKNSRYLPPTFPISASSDANLTH